MKEEWENIWYIGMFGSMTMAAVLLYYKPDTRLATSSPQLLHHSSGSLQHTNMGFKRSQGTYGSPWREV